MPNTSDLKIVKSPIKVCFTLNILKRFQMLNKTDFNNYALLVRGVYYTFLKYYQTFYGREVIHEEWSILDQFDIMDCSQLQEKWYFFTSQARYFLK